jgi:hypothetical protein
MVDIDVAWLALGYTLPKEPSRLRVSIWRRLRKIGAIYTPQGFWLLPHTPRFLEELRPLTDEIVNFQGEFLAFCATDLDPAQHQRLREMFRKARDEEYEEMYGQCARLLAHIDHALLTERFTFAEVEELEEEMGKIERWFDEITSRDIFEAHQRSLAERGLRDCRTSLQSFTERAFERIGEEAVDGTEPNGNQPVVKHHQD